MSVSIFFFELFFKFLTHFFQPCYENIFIGHDYVCGNYGGIVTPEVDFVTIKNCDRNVIVWVMALVMVLVEHNGNGVFFSGPAESRGGGEKEDGEKGKSQEGKKVG